MNTPAGVRDPRSFIPILEGLRQLLLKYEFVSQATLAAEIIDLAHLGSPELSRKLQIGGIWGSAGSLVDVYGLQAVRNDPATERGADLEAERDSIEYRRLLIRLADEMREQGISTDGTEFYAAALKRGLEESPA